MKRLTSEQKRVAIFATMAKATYPMTSREIGIKIGFTTGQPVAKMLCDMWEEGLLVCDQITVIGKPAYLFWLSSYGREQVQALGVENLT